MFCVDPIFYTRINKFVYDFSEKWTCNSIPCPALGLSYYSLADYLTKTYLFAIY